MEDAQNSNQTNAAFSSHETDHTTTDYIAIALV